MQRKSEYENKFAFLISSKEFAALEKILFSYSLKTPFSKYFGRKLSKHDHVCRILLKVVLYIFHHRKRF